MPFFAVIAVVNVLYAFLFAMAGDEEIPILVSFFDNEPKDPFEVVYLTGNGVRYDLRKRVELP